MTSMAPSVRDIVNDSFHEHRPSFRTLLTAWEKGNKGSFYSTATNPTLVKAMQKQKSIRLKEKLANSSFASSISSLNLDFIDEDTDNMDEESENAEGENPADFMETNNKDENSTVLEDVLTDALRFDNAAAVTSDEEDTPSDMKKRRKKRAPKFATENFDLVYKLGKEVSEVKGGIVGCAFFGFIKSNLLCLFFINTSISSALGLMRWLRKEQIAIQGNRTPSK